MKMWMQFNVMHRTPRGGKPAQKDEDGEKQCIQSSYTFTQNDMQHRKLRTREHSIYTNVTTDNI